MRIASVLILSAAAAVAQQPPEFKAPKEIAPGVYEIGAVKLDRATRTVSVPAKVNMTDGLVEYLMVTPQGALHESVLVSDAQPQDVHMAMLLLGAKGMPAEKEAKAPGRIDAEFLAKVPKLQGDRISLAVVWKDQDGAEKTSSVEKWLVRRVAVPREQPRDFPVDEGPWIYTGSYFFENRFLAQSEGVFAAVVTYPAALINNPRKDANDDHLWFVNKTLIPPKNTPVTLTIKLEAANDPEPKPEPKTQPDK